MLPILRHLEPLHRRERWDTLGQMLDNIWSDEFPMIKAFGNMDIYEDENNLHVEAELPGFKRDEIQITLENNVLHLEAERKQESENKDNNYYVRERSQGKMSRVIRLPIPVEPENVKAAFENGILKVTLEKQQKNKTRKIEIK